MLQNLITLLFNSTVLLAVIGAVVFASVSHLIHLREDLVKVVKREEVR